MVRHFSDGEDWKDRRNIGDRRARERLTTDRRTVVLSKQWIDERAASFIDRGLTTLQVKSELKRMGHELDGLAARSVLEERRNRLCQRHREEVEQAKIETTL